MKINNMTKAELELLSHSDIAFLLLTENKKPMNTPKLFKKICELLEYSDDEYTNKVGDFYTSLTNDKRFIMLESAEWDLRDNHAVKIDLDEDDEDESEIDEESLEDEEIEEVDETEIDIEEPIDDEDLELDEDDDIDDLTVIDEEEVEE